MAGIPLVPCMKCEDCQKGNYSLCKHYDFIGSHSFGSYAEYVCVPESNAVRFDDSFIFQKIGLSQIDTAFAKYLVPGTVKGKILIDSEA